LVNSEGTGKLGRDLLHGRTEKDIERKAGKRGGNVIAYPESKHKERKPREIWRKT